MTMPTCIFIFLSIFFFFFYFVGAQYFILREHPWWNVLLSVYFALLSISTPFHLLTDYNPFIHIRWPIINMDIVDILQKIKQKKNYIAKKTLFSIRVTICDSRIHANKQIKKMYFVHMRRSFCAREHGLIFKQKKNKNLCCLYGEISMQFHISYFIEFIDES